MTAFIKWLLVNKDSYKLMQFILHGCVVMLCEHRNQQNNIEVAIFRHCLFSYCIHPPTHWYSTWPFNLYSFRTHRNLWAVLQIKTKCQSMTSKQMSHWNIPLNGWNDGTRACIRGYLLLLWCETVCMTLNDFPIYFYTKGEFTIVMPTGINFEKPWICCCCCCSFYKYKQSPSKCWIRQVKCVCICNKTHTIQYSTRYLIRMNWIWTT